MPANRLLCRLFGSLLFAMICLLAVARPGHAQPTSEAARTEARRLLRQGTASFKQGNYLAALEKFERAYATFPSARIQYNIGQTLRQLRRPVEATEAFETFLNEADRITAQERKETAAALKELDTQVGRLLLTTNVPEVEVTVDGRSRGKTPLASHIVVAPGAHEIILGRMGYKSLRDSVTVAAGEQRRATFNLIENPPPAPVAAPAPLPTPTPAPATAEAPAAVVATPPGQPAPAGGRRTRSTLGVTLLAASAVCVIGGSLLLASSWSRFDDAEKNCTTNCNDAADEVEARSLWSKLLFGAAGLTGLGGAGVLLLAPSPGSRAVAGGVMFVKQGTF
jgi:PEGA domain